MECATEVSNSLFDGIGCCDENTERLNNSNFTDALILMVQKFIEMMSWGEHVEQVAPNEFCSMDVKGGMWL